MSTGQKIREVEARASQDVSLARQDAAYAVKTFKFTLKQQLKPYLLEAKDPNFTPTTVCEKILLSRLHDVLRILHNEGIDI